MDSTLPSGEAAFVCVSRATPKWVRRRPLLLAGWWRLSNRVRRMRFAWIAVLLTAALFLWVIARPEAAATLSFLADRWALAFIGVAIHAASSVSRRKSRLQAEHESSWLAALPQRVSVPARVAFGFGVQAVALGFLCAGIAAAGSARWISPAASTLPAGAPELRSIAGLGHLSTAWLDARTVWLAALGGYLAGGVGGWFAHVFTPKSTASAQYAIVRAVREKWAVAPKLSPLSYWPAAAARAMANPQVSMRTMLFVLLALPMGITGAEAIAAGAAWMVGLYVFLNLVATVRTAFAAGWWLRPTSLQPARFTGALVSRVLLIQVGIFVAALFAMAAIGRPALLHLAVGATVAWLPIYAATAMTACMMGLRPAHCAKKPSTAGRLSGKPV